MPGRTLRKSKKSHAHKRRPRTHKKSRKTRHSKKHNKVSKRHYRKNKHTKRRSTRGRGRGLRGGSTVSSSSMQGSNMFAPSPYVPSDITNIQRSIHTGLGNTMNAINGVEPVASPLPYNQPNLQGPTINEVLRIA